MVESTHPASSTRSQAPVTSTDASTARFQLSAEGFALAELFERVPDVQVEIEPAVANPGDHALLVVRSEDEVSNIDAALQAAPCVGTVERFAERADGGTYRVTWEKHMHGFFQQLAIADITLLSARARGGQWTLRLLASERSNIARAHEILTELGCDPECRTVSTLEGETTESNVTDQQQKALMTAFEAGYYNIPRDVTSEELAAELDISHQALSERFRRAHKQLVDLYFITNAESDPWRS